VRITLAVTATVLCMATCLAACTASPMPAPRLRSDSSVAPALQSLADETWRQFLVVFQARQNCFGEIHLHAAYDLDDRATYDPATAVVTVKVPATVAMLQGALIHEWAHHIEYQCQAHQELRPAFLAAQGLPLETPWRTDNSLAKTSQAAWGDLPSEQYAEAAIELVLGSRRIPTTARVSPQAVQILAAWAAGK